VRVAEHLADALVHVEVVALLVGDEDPVRCILEEGAIAFLARTTGADLVLELFGPRQQLRVRGLQLIAALGKQVDYQMPVLAIKVRRRRES
jgi:hypothetical protein